MAPPGGVVEPHELALLDGALAHRGPDGRGVLALDHDGTLRIGREAREVGRGRLGLVHRRLAILDTSDAGAQPMQRGPLAITYNGEIYNYLELRDELTRLGERFHTRSDTEVILAACARWGFDALSRLEGMFALALLDLRTQTITLARDRYGIKPLLVARVGSGPASHIAFASELRALLPLGSAWTLSPRDTHAYLRHGLTAHTVSSMVQGIQHLPPGTMLTFSLDAAEPAHALDDTMSRAVSFARRTPLDVPATRDDAVAMLRERLQTSVAMHLRSDVPVSAALSGGIDSSSILTLAQAAGGAQAPRTAFTFASGDDADETQWARAAADPLGVSLRIVAPRDTDLADDFDDFVRALDEPAASTSVYAQYRIYRAAREAGLTVLLDGQGADELLAGYATARSALSAQYWNEGRLRDAWRVINETPSGFGGMPRAWQLMFGHLLPGPLMVLTRTLMNRGPAPAFFNRAWVKRHGIVQTDTLARHDLRAQLDLEFSQGLRTLLSYQDRSSMRFGVESRVPFLARDVVELCRVMPSQWLFGKDGLTKSLLRDAMRGLVPDAILDRRDKIGFRTPEVRWMRAGTTTFEPLLDSDALRATGILAPKYLHDLWRSAVFNNGSYHTWCWRWVHFARWLEQTGVGPAG